MIRHAWLVGLMMAGLAAAGLGQAAAPAGVQAPAAGLATRAVGEKPPMSEKQKKLLEDTEKLVKMAAELKVSVEKSNKNELSLDVVRKAEAVELLAKSVKERMRTDR
ncbi:hypothetical protein [Granulicella sibirica]|uniref:Uncharacterized protein n=1 Tax=Granulicella sibirica TaxID=2479048 RepID=A0A4Q0T4S8_9BACT|nr:hypothetical protein [Granulicella sibirica]RXH56586.1 hypothetical protein GRAN_3443 [Granulicella sibirica]